MNRMGVSMAFVIVAAMAATVCAGQTLTYLDLIGRLTDLEHIATLPPEGEQGRMWSSYDRKSYYDEATGRYMHWDANVDGYGGTGWIRRENGTRVLAEMEGPGCIWRMWTATAKQGHVRIYLDGNETPAVDLPWAGYFDGTNPPFDRSALVYTVSMGQNNYVPIPFQRSCKIVADEGYGEYFHFNYTLFPEGTIVPTFKMNLPPEESAALDAANALLSACGPDVAAGRYPDAQRQTQSVTVGANSQKQLFAVDGARAIVSLKMRLPELPGGVSRQRALLRELVLKISWDGQKEPAVWSPLGDFFGTAPGVNLYRSLALGMTDQWFYSNWFMPFGKRAVIEIVNDGDDDVRMDMEIAHTALTRPAEAYGRFHAKWHRNLFLPESPDRRIDWTLLSTRGRGRFAGVQLHVWNPRGGWWGEGDEKFFIDGETFPSIFGTGSEDYFGYAWCNAGRFVAAYHSQPLNENNKGHISNNRWHISDSIPFQTSFEGSIEKYFADDRPTQYAAVAYWYLDAHGDDPYPPCSPAERLTYYDMPVYPLVMNDILIMEEPNGPLEEQGMGIYPDRWSNDRQLWWTPEKIGDTLLLGLDVPEDGQWRITTRLTKAADYGIVQLYLNDQPVTEAIDLYYPRAVIATDEIDLGTHLLKQGRHLITVKIVGSNPDAIRRYMFGMDYLRLERAPLFEVGSFTHIYDPSVGENEPWYINDHCFIFGPDNQWHLFGITRQEPMSPADEDNFAHAASKTLFSTTDWVKKPFALTADPTVGEAHLWAPHVIEHEGLYYMYYCAGGRNAQNYQLKLATSKDLYDWQRHPANPMWVDGFDARDPYILRLEDKWVMYYTATSKPEGGNHVVFSVESDDLIHWGSKKTVFVDPSVGTYGGPTESPFVLRRGSYYYLFIGPRDHYRGTCVYRSKDPFSWTIEQDVGRINAHAAEIIRDVDGSWYVSHCGWGQGGVYLAPLTWRDGISDDDTSLPTPAPRNAERTP